MGVHKSRPRPHPLFWFIEWTINNRGADEEVWMVHSYFRHFPHERYGAF